MVADMRNSYEDLANWIKGETLDLKALLEAFEKRDEVEATKTKLEKQKKSDTASLDKLSAGKSTVKTIFKGASGKQTEITNLQNTIAQVSPTSNPHPQTEKDAENYDIIQKMVLKNNGF